MYILVLQLFHSIRVPLKWYPVKLLHGHLMLVQYPVYCGNAYGVDILEYGIVFYDCSADLSQCDGIICHHHVTDVLFLWSFKKFSSATRALTEYKPVLPFVMYALCISYRMSYQCNCIVVLHYSCTLPQFYFLQYLGRRRWLIT